MGTIQDLPASGEQLFARRSSGLVRAASTTDASLVNLYTATFPIMVSFLLGICLAVLRRCQPVPDDPDRGTARDADPARLRRRQLGRAAQRER